MATDAEIIVHALALRKERRLRIAIVGSEISVIGDYAQPTDLKAVAESGGGAYLTDGTTYEALVGYDIKNDLRRIVVYRLSNSGGGKLP